MKNDVKEMSLAGLEQLTQSCVAELSSRINSVENDREWRMRLTEALENPREPDKLETDFKEIAHHCILRSMTAKDASKDKKGVKYTIMGFIDRICSSQEYWQRVYNDLEVAVIKAFHQEDVSLLPDGLSYDLKTLEEKMIQAAKVETDTK